MGEGPGRPAPDCSREAAQRDRDGSATPGRLSHGATARNGTLAATARAAYRGKAGVSRRRVLAYLDSREIGGAEKCLKSVVGSLADEYAMSVVGIDDGVVEWVAEAGSDVDRLVLPEAPSKTSLAAGGAHVRAFRQLRPDVVHLSLRHPYACQWGTVAGLLAPGAGVLAVEQLPMPPADRMQARIKRILCGRLDAHVAVGRNAARELEGWLELAPSSIGTLYNARPSDPVPRTARPDGPLRCVTVGRMHEQKGFDVLLDALARLPDVEVCLVGDGVERGSLEAQARELGIADRVEFAGWLDDPSPQLGRADLFLLPSRYEGLPLSIIEAMFAELPVIASDVGSVRELVAEGKTGLLVRSGDPGELADAVRRLGADPERRRALGVAGRRKALEHFSLESMIGRYRDLYEALAR